MKRFLEYFRVTLITICFAAGSILGLFSINVSFALSSIYPVILIGMMGGGLLLHIGLALMKWQPLRDVAAEEEQWRQQRLRELEEEEKLKEEMDELLRVAELEEKLQALERKKRVKELEQRLKELEKENQSPDQ